MKLFPLLILCAALALAGGCASLKMLGLSDDSGESAPLETDDPIEMVASRYRRKPAAVREPQYSGEAYAEQHRNSVQLGMRMEEVRSVWGVPNDVETAGPAVLGNQRWTYYQGLVSRFGMGAKKVVYFEDGKVAGWQNSN